MYIYIYIYTHISCIHNNNNNNNNDNITSSNNNSNDQTLYICIDPSLSICAYTYISIFMYNASSGPVALSQDAGVVAALSQSINHNLDSRGFDSIIILVLRGGVLMSMGDFPERQAVRPEPCRRT